MYPILIFPGKVNKKAALIILFVEVTIIFGLLFYPYLSEKYEDYKISRESTTCSGLSGECINFIK